MPPSQPAAGIPNAQLILYPGMGHPASGKQFRQDLLAFLREGRDDDKGSNDGRSL